jgi:hypothetical protein
MDIYLNELHFRFEFSYISKICVIIKVNPIKVNPKMFEKVQFLIFTLIAITSTSEAAADCGPCQGNVLKLASHLVGIHLNFKPLNVIMNQASFPKHEYACPKLEKLSNRLAYSILINP